VIDIGCGPEGGFVPFLRAAGYDAIGVDPKAPDGDEYHRLEFERLDPLQVDAAIASTSLHHVADPGEIVDRLAETLVDGGPLVVVEWASEEFDEATARWSFERLPPEEDENWLHRRRNEWLESGLPWTDYFEDWLTRDGIHRGETLLRLLENRFERRHLESGPYLFHDLARTTEADEQAAIDAGLIQPTRIDWVGACMP
jgi:SAM-dependent methyltransferase